MAKHNLQFNRDNEYYTPRSLVEIFGKFDYDPATTKEKAKEFGIQHYDTIETNGLLRDWTQFTNIWINPPFTIKHLFINKAWETYSMAKNNIFILFPIEFLTTQKFHNVVHGGVIYLPNRRITFESGLGKPSKSPAFGSIVMKLADSFEIKTLKI